MTHSQHCYYRGFWIRNTRWNRATVNSALAAQVDDVTNKMPVRLTTEQMHDPCAIADAARNVPGHTKQHLLDCVASTLLISSSIEAMPPSGPERVQGMRKLMRSLIERHVSLQPLFDAGYMLRFQVVMHNKLLELCAKGLSEAFLAYSVYFPSTCTVEIQPWFKFSSQYYTDEHWYTLKDDPVLRPVAEQVYYLSGFNREWRAELGDWQPCYIGCGDIRCREPTPTWGE